jgi:ABC-type Mn2+/Zn2+ transport system ATPase subunit
MTEAILSIKDVTKHFGGLAAVENLSLEVNVGELHAIIGPNGAGKTTLINLLSGELAPSSWRDSLPRRGHHAAQPRKAIPSRYRPQLSEDQCLSELQRAGKLPPGGAVARPAAVPLATRRVVL